MKVYVGSTAGFCWGVKRAFDRALAALAGPGPVHTIGPLVHNQSALDMLEKRGLSVAASVSEITSGTVVIRAHGISPKVQQDIRDKGLSIVDATCPHVRRIQERVEEAARLGMTVCIAGYSNHPEIEALVACSGKRCTVVASENEADAVRADVPLLLVAQSTFSSELFERIRDLITANCADVTVYDSICSATCRRQDEVRLLAQQNDAVVIVGGYHSSNTKRLAEISVAQGTPTYHVDSPEALDLAELARFKSVGVTAGASTPTWVTSAIVDALRGLQEEGARAAVLLRIVLSGFVESGLYGSCAAAALTATACIIQGIPVKWIYLAASFCYIFSIYALSRLQRGPHEMPLTRRLAFLSRHRRLMSFSSLTLAAAALALAVAMGPLPVVLVAGSYLLGAAYAVPVIPRSLGLRYRRLQDIPASKDIFAAAAWTVICCIVPLAHSGGSITGLSTALAAGFVFFTVSAKATMYDSVDIQADRVLGRETLPVLLGERNTWRILWGLTVGSSAMLIGLYLAGHSALPFLAGPLYIAVYLVILRRGLITSEDVNAALVDGELFLLGVISFLVV